MLAATRGSAPEDERSAYITRSRVREKDSKTQHVVQVAVGLQHALLLTDEGIVYSWGVALDCLGQLGRGDNDGKWQEPEHLVVSPDSDPKKKDAAGDKKKDEIVIQVACGSNHCLALTQKGAIYAWGSNKAGQLGMGSSGSKKSPFEKAPKMIETWNGKNMGRLAKSISCGPDSSACVTTRGEVYVWGALSYYLFDGGKHHKYEKGESCQIPVKVRGVQDTIGIASDYHPMTVALYKDVFACTVAPKSVEAELVEAVNFMKGRASSLHAMARARRNEQSGRGRGGASDANATGDLQHLGKETKVEAQRCQDDIAKNREEREKFQSDLMRVNRELTVHDQQSTALNESASKLEAKRPEGGGEKDKGGGDRQLRTEINDINHFKQSIQQSKVELLKQRDKLDQELGKLDQEFTVACQNLAQFDAKAKLWDMLQKGDVGGQESSTIDEGLKIANNKRMELADTDPNYLAGTGKGHFSGLREVLSISDRALLDVSSALKEVSAVATGGDGVALETVLEYNMKLRKRINQHIAHKLSTLETKPDEMGKLGAHGHGHIMTFFRESATPAKKEPPKEEKKTGLAALGGFFT